MAGGTVRIGTSGWSYPGWRGDFYPRGLVQRRELAYAAERLDSIEINGSFYSLQRPSSYVTWHDETPDDFVFAVKGGRFITHMKRLSGVETPLANFFASGPLLLRHKLGPFLWQLPANFAFDAERLHAFFDLLPRKTSEAAELAARHDDKVPPNRAAVSSTIELPLRHALEPRHESFRSEQASACLRSHRIATVVADSATRFPQLDAVTSDHVYIRLHGAEELYTSGYDDRALDTWAERISAWADDGADVYVYFDNDAKGHAPHDAVRLRQRLRPLLAR